MTTQKAIQCQYGKEHDIWSCTIESDFIVKFKAPPCGHEYNYGRGLIHLYCKEHLRYAFSELVNNYVCVACGLKYRFVDMFISAEPL